MNHKVSPLGSLVSENGGLSPEEKQEKKQKGRKTGQRAREGHRKRRAWQVHRGKDRCAAVCTLNQLRLRWSPASPECRCLSERATPEEGNKPANENHGKIHHLARTCGDFIPYQTLVPITSGLVSALWNEATWWGPDRQLVFWFSFGDHVHRAAVWCPINRNGFWRRGLLFWHISYI